MGKQSDTKKEGLTQSEPKSLLKKIQGASGQLKEQADKAGKLNILFGALSAVTTFLFVASKASRSQMGDQASYLADGLSRLVDSSHESYKERRRLSFKGWLTVAGLLVAMVGVAVLMAVGLIEKISLSLPGVAIFGGMAIAAVSTIFSIFNLKRVLNDKSRVSSKSVVLADLSEDSQMTIEAKGMQINKEVNGIKYLSKNDRQKVINILNGQSENKEKLILPILDLAARQRRDQFINNIVMGVGAILCSALLFSGIGTIPLAAIAAAFVIAYPLYSFVHDRESNKKHYQAKAESLQGKISHNPNMFVLKRLYTKLKVFSLKKLAALSTSLSNVLGPGVGVKTTDESTEPVLKFASVLSDQPTEPVLKFSSVLSNELGPGVGVKTTKSPIISLKSASVERILESPPSNAEENAQQSLFVPPALMEREGTLSQFVRNKQSQNPGSSLGNNQKLSSLSASDPDGPSKELGPRP
ncbi:MAG: hypothetical protein FJ186_01585 [Gammaproteobacteria bacterium]|nr:hypothetical protein [Gammaproteobacteria bacterium]